MSAKLALTPVGDTFAENAERDPASIDRFTRSEAFAERLHLGPTWQPIMTLLDPQDRQSPLNFLANPSLGASIGPFRFFSAAQTHAICEEFRHIEDDELFDRFQERLVGTAKPDGGQWRDGDFQSLELSWEELAVFLSECVVQNWGFVISDG